MVANNARMRVQCYRPPKLAGVGAFQDASVHFFTDGNRRKRTVTFKFFSKKAMLYAPKRYALRVIKVCFMTKKGMLF